MKKFINQPTYLFTFAFTLVVIFLLSSCSSNDNETVEKPSIKQEGVAKINVEDKEFVLSEVLTYPFYIDDQKVGTTYACFYDKKHSTSNSYLEISLFDNGEFHQITFIYPQEDNPNGQTYKRFSDKYVKEKNNFTYKTAFSFNSSKSKKQLSLQFEGYMYGMIMQYPYAIDSLKIDNCTLNFQQ